MGLYLNDAAKGLRNEFLHEVYKTLQKEIDVIGEILRTTKAFVPNSLTDVIGISPIMDLPTDGSADELLQIMLETMDVLIDQYKDLYKEAEDAEAASEDPLQSDPRGVPRALGSAGGLSHGGTQLRGPALGSC